MTVSTMFTGAGSSAEAARPILPTTDSTSGIARRAMSCLRMMSMASPMEACGMVVGMYRNDPSSSGGMNSLPNPGNAWTAHDHGRLWRRERAASGQARSRPAGTKPKIRSNPSQAVYPKITIAAGSDRNASLCSRHHRRRRA